MNPILERNETVDNEEEVDWTLGVRMRSATVRRNPRPGFRPAANAKKCCR